MKSWCKLDALVDPHSPITRQHVLDANDLIDALEEAEDQARQKASTK